MPERKVWTDSAFQAGMGAGPPPLDPWKQGFEQARAVFEPLGAPETRVWEGLLVHMGRRKTS